MPNSLVKINIHLIFHTKSEGVTVATDDLPRLFDYIGGIIRATGGISFKVGGMPDHVHVLMSIPPTVALADYVRNLKAKSSRWLKTVSPQYAGFSWQEGYGAFSVSPTLIDKTIAYISNQAEHHRKRTFREEVLAFVEAYKVENADEHRMLQ